LTSCDPITNDRYSAAIILFLVLLFRFIADLPNHPDVSPAEKGKEFVDILIVAVTVIVVAIPGKQRDLST
jgi:Ca2+-transporting ATPase